MAVSKRRAIYSSFLFFTLSIFTLLATLIIGRAVSDGALASCIFQEKFELLEVAEREFSLSMRAKLEGASPFTSYVKSIHAHPNGERYGFVNFESQSDDPKQYIMFIDEDCTQYIEEQ